MKSRNDLHERIKALLAQGKSQAQAAKALGVSTSTVSRTLADHRGDDGRHPAMDAVDTFVASLGKDLAPDVLPRVEALRGLAAKIDWSRSASSAGAALAVSSLTKEFRSLLDELRASSSFDELREALLRADDD
jgi:transcriptional regulator with XRE-family HTH domain